MSLSIENAQKITDLRQRMLRNIQDGKPAHDGLTEAEYRECLDAVRGSRAQAAAAAASKASKAKAVKPPKPATSGSRLANLAKYNLD